MSQVPIQKYAGKLIVDLTPVADFLVDLPQGTLQVLRVKKDGMGAVIEELAVSVPAYGAAACIPADVYAHFVTRTNKLGQIRAAREAVTKLAEILAESEANVVHERENDVGLMVDAARSASRRKGDPALVAPFEKTIAYNGQTGVKAAQTRKRNAEAKKKKEEEEKKKAPVDPKV